MHLPARRRLHRPSVRLRLTALYGTLSVLSGAAAGRLKHSVIPRRNRG